MATLLVRLNGEEVARVTLEPGQEYIAGRAADAAIQLKIEKGISRHHVKFFERDGVWICEALSKFGLLQRGTESQPVIELTEWCAFVVTPYEFIFEPDVKAEEVPAAEDAEPKNVPAFYQPRLNPGPESAPDQTAPRGNNEATVAAVATLVPYFRISYPNTADDEVLKLEGDLWVAGRESSSEIPIDSPHISRKHFELARTREGFFITDLGSSNGTRVNGEKIPAHEPTRIESGDEIRVQNIQMTFEIRDTQFANRLDRLPVANLGPLADMGGGGLSPYGGMNLPAMMDPTEYRPPSELAAAAEDAPLTPWQKLKANKVRLALVVLIPIVLIVAMMPDKKKDDKEPRVPAGANTTPNFENLSKEQKLVVKDSFNLARNLYVQGKYALCLTELAKLHELIPQYENSKELQSFCEQGLELVRREEERQRQQREREEVEQRIAGFVDNCKNTLDAEASVEETRRCLAPAIELAPEHNLVIELIHTAQMHEEEKKFMAEQKATEDKKAAKGVAHFNRALGIYKEGQLAKAVTEFETFLNSKYPRADKLKAEARREIASIKKELKTKVDSLLENCRQLGGKGSYREAWQSCDKATNEDPENKEAKDIKDKMLGELTRKMRAKYEDSVLEESLGNVDSAKEKWKEIVSEDLPFGKYYGMAKSKLAKYNGGS